MMFPYADDALARHEPHAGFTASCIELQNDISTNAVFQEINILKVLNGLKRMSLGSAGVVSFQTTSVVGIDLALTHRKSRHQRRDRLGGKRRSWQRDAVQYSPRHLVTVWPFGTVRQTPTKVSKDNKQQTRKFTKFSSCGLAVKVYIWHKIIVYTTKIGLYAGLINLNKPNHYIVMTAVS